MTAPRIHTQPHWPAPPFVAGVWVDGMDALSVKSATAFAKKYVLENGPLMLEMVRPVLTSASHAHIRLRPFSCL